LKRVVVITDNPLIVAPIRTGLHATGAFELLGYLAPIRATAAGICKADPEVLLVDECDELDGALDLIRAIKERDERIWIVVLAVRMEGDWPKRALEAGASGAISKVIHPAALATLLREAVEGHLVHSPTALAKHSEVPEVQFTGESRLTEREDEILRRVASGATNGEIARQLWITQQTVKFHLSNIYRKLELANRTEACHYAHVTGLVAPREELAAASR
jgi:DNA-binding NarL/FixJ family response regulator